MQINSYPENLPSNLYNTEKIEKPKKPEPLKPQRWKCPKDNLELEIYEVCPSCLQNIQWYEIYCYHKLDNLLVKDHEHEQQKNLED